MDTEYRPDQPPPAPTLISLIHLLGRNKSLAFAVIVACVVVARVAMIFVPKSYEVSILLSPASSSSGVQGGGLAGLVSQFGGLASLAGISVGNDSRKAEEVAVLQSEELTTEYIRENNLLPVLFWKRWDASKRRWKPGKAKNPTLWDANRFFKGQVRTIATDAKTGLVTMTIHWRDPVVAAAWANGLVEMANSHLRTKAITEADRNIAYLHDQAAKTDLVEIRSAIYAILQNEIDKEMLARGSEEYAFHIVDPAVAPERPSSPQLGIWLAGGLAVGIALSILLAIARESRSGRNRN